MVVLALLPLGLLALHPRVLEPVLGLVRRVTKRPLDVPVPAWRDSVVVVLRYFADLAYADIAELTQQTVNSVGVTLLRARERLRGDLERQGVATDGLP